MESTVTVESTETVTLTKVYFDSLDRTLKFGKQDLRN